jgi:hypothetical protein
MVTNSTTRRQLIEEEVYDELPSHDILDKNGCDIEYKNFNSNEIIFLKNSKELLSVCLVPTLSILTLLLD